MFAPRLDPPVNNNYVLLFCQNRNKIRLYVCFLIVILKIARYGLVIILRFCHRYIIHDDETVSLNFMPSHEMSSFLYNLKA